MNNILLKRMCQLIAATYAIKPEKVWEIYSNGHSLEETIEIVSNLV